jgi:hypothetical protein
MLKRNRIVTPVGHVVVVACLGILGCGGPSAQEQRAFLEFYSAVDEVWGLMSTPNDKDAEAKLEKAVARKDAEAKMEKAFARVEEAGVRYKAIPPKVRKKLYEMNRAVHEWSHENYMRMLEKGSDGNRYYNDIYNANKRVSDILIDTFGVTPNKPSPPVVNESLRTYVNYAYEQAYRK